MLLQALMCIRTIDLGRLRIWAILYVQYKGGTHSVVLSNGCCCIWTVVELEVAEDRCVGEEDEEGVQHDDSALDHQRVV